MDGRVGGFIAPCGLLEVQIKGYTATGAPVPFADMPNIDLLLHVAPGMYKGCRCNSNGAVIHLNPPTAETVKGVVTASSVISHIRNNRIEYLACTILLHLLGATNYAFDKAQGVC